jgi:hypothetical protein
MCWGYWGKQCAYANKSYAMQGLLQDPKPGVNWVQESYVVANVGCEGSVKIVRGTFRHITYVRLSTFGLLFPNLTCSSCSKIPQEKDFRMQVMREDRSLEKRGTRGTASGHRLGYIFVLELAKSCRIITKKYRIERAFHVHNWRRVAQLKMCKPLIKELHKTGDVQTDLMRFCTNIVSAHRTSAFGGKLALWDFMKDVARNLNRKKQGFRFSQNIESFGQTLKIYGGR